MSTRGFVGYQYRGKIKGWYNHSDSYQDYLGEYAVEKFAQHSLAELKDFFLNRVTLGAEDNYENHKSVFELNWSKDKVCLEDGKQFYKDGLFCEYAYIFNLDGEEKSLMLFKGYGDKPDPDRKDWFYESQGEDKKKFYVNLKGVLTGDKEEIEALVDLHLSYAEDTPMTESLKKLKEACQEELPTLIGYAEDYPLAQKYLEYRMKGI